MDKTENVETTDYAVVVKEAAVKGAVTAVVSIAVTYVVSSLINKVQSRRDKTDPTVATATE